MIKLPANKSQQFFFQGERLRMIREANHSLQEELADLLGVSRTQVVNLERGNTEPSMRVLIAICQEFKVSADWMLGLTDTLPEWLEVIEEVKVIQHVARRKTED